MMGLVNNVQSGFRNTTSSRDLNLSNTQLHKRKTKVVNSGS